MDREGVNGIKDTIIKFALVLFGMALGYFIYGFYINYPDHRILFFVFADILILTLIFFIVRFKYKNDSSLYLKELTVKVKNLSDGGVYAPGFVKTTKEAQDLYEAVENLRKDLQRQIHSKDSVFSVVNALAANMDLSKMLDELLPKLSEATKSNWSAFYYYNTLTNKLELKTSLGFSKNIYKEFDVTIGEGIVGCAADSKEIQLINDIPDDTIYISRTFFGKIKPKAILAIPVLNEGEVVAVLVIGSIFNYGLEELEIIEMIKYYLGVAIANGLAYVRSQRLKNELQFQNQLIQNMNEDLENKVLERTEYINSLIDSIKDYAIISTDRDLLVTTWNKGAEIMLGYTFEEMSGKNVTLIGGDKSMQINYTEHFKKAKSEGRFSVLSWRKRKDGNDFLAEITINAIFDTDGEIFGYSQVMRDASGTGDFLMR